MLRRPLLNLVTLCLALCAPLATASDGKWTPRQVQALGPAWVKQQGFDLPLAKLWDEGKQQGLLANAVQLPGCSGSFVSKDGLLITNHHCVVSILQEHSTPQQNLARDGYLATSRDAEKASKSFRVQVPRAFKDVTAEVLAAIPASVDDLGRYRAVEAVQKRLVAACEAQPGTRCTFAAFDGGLFYTLTEFTELSDVRLVWAPPASVGDFGGETDNWTWPRHTGDFALVRVYDKGQPYQPPVWFPVSTKGVSPGTAVAVLGYPGTSFRTLLADEVQERQERWYPRVRDLAAEWIAIVEAEGKKSPEVTVATSDELRGLLNLRKNAEGQLAGLARGQVVAKRREAEARVKAFAAKGKTWQGALAAYDGLVALAAERQATWDHDFALDWSVRGSKALAWALTIARRSVEAQRPDAEREPGWQDRDLPRLRERLERDQKRYAAPVSQRLLASWWALARALPKDQRLSAVDAVGDTPPPTFHASPVLDLAQRKAMFDETPDQLAARNDPLLTFALALDAERRALRDRRDAQAGRALELKPRWRKAVVTEAGRPVAPDANATLRVTFGRVKGYSPRDAVTLEPQTTLAGMLAKAGPPPCDVPEPVRAAAAKAGARWRDARLADVPVDFLADCDTTGGNSGSPTIDGQGRLVGVNFDRVWENVANDFGYTPEIARNVNADVRYLLWQLDEVEHADGLLAELGVKQDAARP